MNRQELAQKIIDTCLEMTRLGLNQGTAGNVSVQQVPNGNGGSDDWIVVSPGESGRGVKIVDENGKPYLLVYEGAASDRKKLSYELLAGLPFFSNANVLITTKGDKLIAAVELGRPFSEAEASAADSADLFLGGRPGPRRFCSDF